MISLLGAATTVGTTNQHTLSLCIRMDRICWVAKKGMNFREQTAQSAQNCVFFSGWWTGFFKCALEYSVVVIPQVGRDSQHAPLIPVW